MEAKKLFSKSTVFNHASTALRRASCSNGETFDEGI